MKNCDTILNKVICICDVCNKQFSGRDAKMVNKLMSMHLLKVHYIISKVKNIQNIQDKSRCLTDAETKTIIDNETQYYKYNGR